MILIQKLDALETWLVGRDYFTIPTNELDALIAMAKAALPFTNQFTNFVGLEEHDNFVTNKGFTVKEFRLLQEASDKLNATLPGGK